MPETNRIEHKRELHTDVDIEKEVIAFLNYHEGGVIYIGIDKAGKVVGVADPDGDTLKIKDRIKNNISPSAMGLFDVVVEEREGIDAGVSGFGIGGAARFGCATDFGKLWKRMLSVYG